MMTGVEMFNVSASWRQFARIGRLGIPTIPGDSVVACQSGTSDPGTGVGLADNILYVKGILNCQ